MPWTALNSVRTRRRITASPTPGMTGASRLSRRRTDRFARVSANQSGEIARPHCDEAPFV